MEYVGSVVSELVNDRLPCFCSVCIEDIAVRTLASLASCSLKSASIRASSSVRTPATRLSCWDQCCELDELGVRHIQVDVLWQGIKRTMAKVSEVLSDSRLRSCATAASEAMCVVDLFCHNKDQTEYLLGQYG